MRFHLQTIVFVCVLLIGATPALRADEGTRQVQEELRKRNLYFGDIDGQSTEELTGALKRYQKRKGFEVTGNICADTAASLHIEPATAPSKILPDVPVLRSDAARDLPGAERVALEQAAEENLDTSPAPLPPAEAPGPGQDLTPERVTKFVEAYLRDAETPDVAAQVKYYAFPVLYFDHGSSSKEFVNKDTSNYVKHWPKRKYTLTKPIRFFGSEKEDETLVQFTIAFEVQNRKHTASGRTENWWTLRPEGEELKIVAIREKRLANK